ncbi:chemotaxis protein methyltransferase CheR [Methylomagnum ishizawai]|uniref:Chemotaxis protein methyltransferase n=1 Tax=Methylomagnum ishizawai TaxID=1760988 RepID=A0A1Y6CUX4_9GAMM|nr:protein-glutamate O-methyltransferase CheR [Methylomagnum ishizawai]SMF94117.1 chemotaxis protein methyltransferase CheR [Methylomagnum ishizawai]
MSAPANKPGYLREFEYGLEDFERLRSLSFAYSGIRVPDDKFDMFYSRLAKRLRALGLTRFRDYCAMVEDQAGPEFTEFINAITTNLTAFFRENHHFDYLRAQVVPHWLRRNAASRRARVWSAGCSTGEEPYSIAMTLLEADTRLGGWDLKILATDLDTRVLATAAAGVYDADSVGRLEQERLRRWFLKGGGQHEGRVKVKDAVRDLVHFQQLNLIGPWDLQGPFDLIFCRNVLIYFDQPTKARLIGRYFDLLVPGGYLFIGHSESLHTFAHRFENLGQTMYRKPEAAP